MRRTGLAAAGLVAIAGCTVAPPGAREMLSYDKLPTAVRSSPRETNKPKFGPPPPGYIRIRGEAVPGWRPEDMLYETRGPLSWYPLGPRPIIDEYWSGYDDASGRVVSVAVHPSDPQMVYIASASGGVWKTTDGGGLWVPLTDELSNLNHGYVTLDPSDAETIYVGTGEYTVQSSGDGLFRSTDGGLSWERIATTDEVGSACSGIAIDPTDPDTIHVTGNRGYVRSTDGGATWDVRLGAWASSVVLNPLDPSVVYVGRHNIGVYRSTDGGTSFTQLTNGLPSSNVRRVLLAISASNPNVLYTAIINPGAGLLGLYKTTDGGESWTEKTNTPDFPYPQGWYDAFVGVDPTDENTVYCGGVFPTYAVAGVIKSTDGGDSWTDITIGTLGGQLHPDQHAITFGPDGTIWIGNDGGVWKSHDGGQSWINTNPTLTVTQNYNIALHPTDPAQVMGGTQDNGTVERDFDIEEWPQILSGDGGFLAYDHAWPERRYTTYVYLSVYRLEPDDWANISGPWGSDPRNFIAPLVMDPSDAHTLLGGTNRVWRTHNAHADADWTPISGTEVGGGGTLNAIAVAQLDSDTIYTGSSTGKVFVTTDASFWHDRSAGLPGGQVSDIFIHPDDPIIAYIAFHNTSGPRVLRTEDQGLTWTDVTGDMPDGVSARALAVDWRFDPPHLYSGCGVGVYSSFNGGVTWEKDGTDLPNVNVGDLAIDPVRNTITVGTYGRGAWRAELPDSDIPGDLNGDGCVDQADLGILLTDWDCQPPDPCPGDCDGDGDTDHSDLGILLAHWGEGCP